MSLINRDSTFYFFKIFNTHLLLTESNVFIKVHLNCEYFLLQLLTSLIKFNIASVWDIAEQLHCAQSEYLEYNFVD